MKFKGNFEAHRSLPVQKQKEDEISLIVKLQDFFTEEICGFLMRTLKQVMSLYTKTFHYGYYINK